MEQSAPPPPGIAALFTVVFDQKVGYSLAFHRSLADVDLDGVEYKSLPSGLHAVDEDVVYFTHGVKGNCVGISAFLQGAADEAHRNASFVAVGALVRSGDSNRLGKAWMLAGGLRELARKEIEGGNGEALEAFWTAHKRKEDGIARTLSNEQGGKKRKRTTSSASDSFASLSPDHPALTLHTLLDAFGPLIYPLYRAALLRKRILILTSPPIQHSCDFIYLLSILSGLPPDLLDLIQSPTDSDAPSVSRIRTLFSVGIHDIPSLSSERSKEGGWIACTTDDILGEKRDLYDILVTLPQKQHAPRPWPKIVTADGRELRATQRDLRRWRLLRSALASTREIHYRDDESDDQQHILATPLLNSEPEPETSDLVEPMTWTAVAYTGFMWWASAGEAQAWEAEESRADHELWDELPDANDLLRHLDLGDEDARKMAQATVITAYFKRLTSSLLTPLSEVIEDADDEAPDDADGNEAIVLSVEDVRAMGLDGWSVADTDFVKEAVALYFGREAKMGDRGEVWVCGVRIC